MKLQRLEPFYNKISENTTSSVTIIIISIIIKIINMCLKVCSQFNNIIKKNFI